MLKSSTSRNTSSSRSGSLTRLAGPWGIIPASDESLWRLAVPPVGAGSHPHNVRVNCTGNTVLHLGIQLRQSVLLIDAGFLNISHRGLLDNVPHQESLDGLVLRAALAAVGAADELDVSTAVLVATSISALESHGVPGEGGI